MLRRDKIFYISNENGVDFVLIVIIAIIINIIVINSVNKQIFFLNTSKLKLLYNHKEQIRERPGSQVW